MAFSEVSAEHCFALEAPMPSSLRHLARSGRAGSLPSPSRSIPDNINTLQVVLASVDHHFR